MRPGSLHLTGALRETGDRSIILSIAKANSYRFHLELLQLSTPRGSSEEMFFMVRIVHGWNPGMGIHNSVHSDATKFAALRRAPHYSEDPAKLRFPVTHNHTVTRRCRYERCQVTPKCIFD